jgi:hypothetical protein
MTARIAMSRDDRSKTAIAVATSKGPFVELAATAMWQS